MMVLLDPALYMVRLRPYRAQEDTERILTPTGHARLARPGPWASPLRGANEHDVIAIFDGHGRQALTPSFRT